ncbi:MAG: PIG-L family deacetylase, partial [Candidatus Promineifilaceae bacterium]
NVSLICMTKGEAGEISDLKLASHENLGVVRERELRCACEVIGIKELHLMDYCDSGMDGTLENRKTTAFINADPQKVRFKLVKLLREIRPDVVITFEPNGWYGHPDHIAAGRFATESCRLAGIPEAFPEAGPTWEPSRLFQAVLMRSEFAPAYAYIRSQGWDSSDFDSLAIDEPDPLAEKITHVIDAHPYSDVKEQIMECHKTQFGDDHIFKKLPADLWRSCNAKEYFIQVDPAPVGQTGRESDLFAGLDGD